jgi:O-antigen ligase
VVVTTPPAGARTAAVAEAAILAALVVAPWPYGSAVDVARYALAAVLLASVAGWALAVARGGGALPRLAAPALALPALALLQVLLARSVAPVFTVEAAALLAAMCGVIVFWSERGREAAPALRLIVAVLATGIAQAAFGAAQWSLGPARIYGQVSPFVTAPFGSYVNHNHFAGLVGMAAVLAAGVAVAYARRGGEVPPALFVSAAAALGLTAAHFASRSRGGLVALLAGLLALGGLWLLATAARGGRLRRVAPLMVIAALAVAAFGWFAIPAPARRHLGTAFAGPVDGSGSYRVDVAAATLRAFADRPLAGFGMGAYEDAITAYKRAHGDVRVRHAESDALELLVEGGLAGLLVVGWLAAGVLRGLRDRVVASRDRFRNGLALAAAAAAATLLVHSLLDFNLRLPANALVFAALAGLAAAPRTEPARLGGPRLAKAVALGFALLAAGCAWRAAGAIAEERALAERDPLVRLARLDRALAAHPYSTPMLRARAQVWRDLAHRPPGWNAPRLTRAEADLRRALALRPRWAEARADLGWVRSFRGDAPGARAEMEAAARLDPTHLDVALSLADLRARQGDVDGAIAALQALRGAHPGWSGARARATASRWTTDPSQLDRLATP